MNRFAFSIALLFLSATINGAQSSHQLSIGNSSQSVKQNLTNLFSQLLAEQKKTNLLLQQQTECLEVLIKLSKENLRAFEDLYKYNSQSDEEENYAPQNPSSQLPLLMPAHQVFPQGVYYYSMPAQPMSAQTEAHNSQNGMLVTAHTSFQTDYAHQ